MVLLFLLWRLVLKTLLIWDTRQTISRIHAANYLFEDILCSKAITKTKRKPQTHLMEIGSVQEMSVKSTLQDEYTSSIESRTSSKYTPQTFTKLTALVGPRRVHFSRTSRKPLQPTPRHRNHLHPRRQHPNLSCRPRRHRPRTLRRMGLQSPPSSHLPHRNRLRLR